MTYPSTHIPMPAGYKFMKPPPNLDHGSRGGPPRAFVWHMAEGNNVAAYLSRNPARGVSVNFTVEADGTIYHMVHPDRISGSVNPQTIRTDNDPKGSIGTIVNGPDAGFYGATVAKQLLGSGWRDPNRWCIGVELAGRANDGPNAKQVVSMARLVADMRERYGPSLRGNLGHRDWQDVKMCPGRRVPWAAFGGHGLFKAAAPVPQEGDEMIVDLNVRRTALVPAGVSIAERSGGPEVAKTSDEQRRYVPGFSLDLKWAMVASDFGASPGFSRGLFVDAKALKDIQVAPDEPVPEPVPGCTPEELNAATNQGFNSALTVAQAAILAIAPRDAQ